MHPTIIKELIALIVLIISVCLFYAAVIPMAYFLSYGVVVAMFIVFAVSMIKRTDKDEREEAHRTMAAESGYIAGAVTLLVAVAIQAVQHTIADPWLFIALIVMLLTRLIVRIYIDKKQA